MKRKKPGPKAAEYRAVLENQHRLIGMQEAIIAVLVERLGGSARVSLEEVNAIAPRADLARGISDDGQQMAFALKYKPGFGPPARSQKRLIVVPGEMEH